VFDYLQGRMGSPTGARPASPQWHTRIETAAAPSSSSHLTGSGSSHGASSIRSGRDHLAAPAAAAQPSGAKGSSTMSKDARRQAAHAEAVALREAFQDKLTSAPEALPEPDGSEPSAFPARPSGVRLGPLLVEKLGRLDHQSNSSPTAAAATASGGGGVGHSSSGASAPSHDRDYLWPVGFRAKRLLRQPPAYGAGGRGREVKATLQISPGPKFIVLLEMARGEPPTVVNTTSADATMRQVVKKLNGTTGITDGAWLLFRGCTGIEMVVCEYPSLLFVSLFPSLCLSCVIAGE